jgi:hypothetical protein
MEGRTTFLPEIGSSFAFPDDDATGFTAHLRSGSSLEHAQQPFAKGSGLRADLSAEGSGRRRITAHHEALRPTTDQGSLDEIERIAI